MKLSKGFTLIELIVVMAVFMFIIGTAVNIFISMAQYQRRILSEQEFMNQASYLVEHMSKALMMAKKDDGGCLGNPYIGYNYLLTNYDANSGKYLGIKFMNQNTDACTELYLDRSDPENPVIKEKVKNSDAISLTSTKFKVNYLGFIINGRKNDRNDPNSFGASEKDGVQPRITVILDIQSKEIKDRPPTRIQTTVSQRNLNEPLGTVGPSSPVITARSTTIPTPDGASQEISILATIADPDGVSADTILCTIKNSLGITVASGPLTSNGNDNYSGTWILPTGDYYATVYACDILGNCTTVDVAPF